MPNITAMPQPSEVRHTRPRGRAAPSSGAASPGVTAASWMRASSALPCVPARSTPIHDSAAATAISDHTPSETRQPAASASGTASRAGSIVPTCRMVM